MSSTSPLRIANRYAGSFSAFLLALGLGLCPGPSGAEGEAGRWLRPEQRSLLEASGRVAPDVVDELAAHGAARVIVALEVLAPGGGPALQRFARSEERAELLRTGEDVLAAAGEHFLPTYRLHSVPALTGAADAEGMLRLAEHPAVEAVALDLPQRAFLKESVPLIRVPPLRGLGMRGAGVTVAVIDTGVDFRHKALKKARAGEACFCISDVGGCCPNGREVQLGTRSAVDGDGHGTHVAGIVASRGKGGAPTGVAPRSRIVAVRTLGADGAGSLSGTLAALDWLLTERPDVDVVNLSLGSNQLFKGVCDRKGGGFGAVFGSAVDALQARGTLVVAASGNDGSRKKMSMPACLRGAVSVGAGFDAQFSLDSAGACTQRNVGVTDIACFSNRPKKMDIIAPGVLITSAAPRKGSTDAFGTSMAAPHVAGCAALLKGVFPGASSNALTTAMVRTGVPIRDNRGRRFPRLDCEAAAIFLASQP